VNIDKIHPVVCRRRDAKETVLWDGKMLNMDLVLAPAEDEVPLAKEPGPCRHLFPDAGGGLRLLLTTGGMRGFLDDSDRVILRGSLERGTA
jgi:hypothetical protein